MNATSILEAALTGYWDRKAEIEAAMVDIRERLGGDHSTATSKSTSVRPKRKIFAAARRRIAAAERKRWAKYHKKKHVA